ncbi:MAG: Rpn family recombination-promoting nuclease/putative transposase, partial [Deltaproteobacteria bacterium]|nr:Rpn family recombination-promoting nuclease/putative transposase [Deltaproteobacteria bacterium]
MPHLGALFETAAELKRYLPDFDYLLFDLYAMMDKDIKGEAKTRMTLLLQKHINDDQLITRLPELADIYAELPTAWNREEYLRAVAQYLLNTDKLTRRDLDNFLDQATAGRGGEIMPTIAETILEEGIQKGLQQGIQKGMQEGIQKGVLLTTREDINDLL